MWEAWRICNEKEGDTSIGGFSDFVYNCEFRNVSPRRRRCCYSECERGDSKVGDGRQGRAANRVARRHDQGGAQRRVRRDCRVQRFASLALALSTLGRPRCDECSDRQSYAKLRVMRERTASLNSHVVCDV